eukprot:6439348-Lingulodinium_polyedra.AAC.1
MLLAFEKAREESHDALIVRVMLQNVLWCSSPDTLAIAPSASRCAGCRVMSLCDIRCVRSARRVDFLRVASSKSALSSAPV